MGSELPFAALAKQTGVLEKLGGYLPAAKQEERWDQLEAIWTDELDQSDFLTAEADEGLVAALEAHVSKYIEHYSKISK